MTEKQPSHPEILDILRTAPLGMETPAEIDDDRARLLPWLTEQVGQLPERRAQANRARFVRRASGVLSLLAAAAGVFFVVGHATAPLAPSASASAEPAFATLVSGTVESGTVEILPGSKLGLTSEVRTPVKSRAVLAASSGYRVELSPSTELAFTDPTATRTRLRLRSGQVELSVPKLAPGHTLEVETGDARVRVRGTRFSVQLMGELPTARTCVEVSEGLVEVERDGKIERVAAGQRSGCTDDAPAVDTKGPAETTTAGKAPRPQVTSLAQENHLFAQALAAERAGRPTEARRQFAELLRRFPESRFLPETKAGLARLNKTK